MHRITCCQSRSWLLLYPLILLACSSNRAALSTEVSNNVEIYSGSRSGYYHSDLTLKIYSSGLYSWEERNGDRVLFSEGFWNKNADTITLSDHNQTPLELVESDEYDSESGVCIKVQDQFGESLSFGAAELSQGFVVQLDSNGTGCALGEKSGKIKLYQNYLFYEYSVQDSSSSGFDFTFADLSVINRAFIEMKISFIDSLNIKIDSTATLVRKK